MVSYINSLIAVILLAEIVMHVSPDGDIGKRYVRLICSLAVLLTMISPIKSAVSSLSDGIGTVADFFSADEKTVTEREELAPAAETILSYIKDTCGKRADGASLTFVTDGAGEVTEVQVFLPHGDSHTQKKLSGALDKGLNIRVSVFCGEDTDGGEGKTEEK